MIKTTFENAWKQAAAVGSAVIVRRVVGETVGPWMQMLPTGQRVAGLELWAVPGLEGSARIEILRTEEGRIVE